MKSVYDRKNITVVLTEECNFRCKYCYMVGKNSRKRMSADVARKAVDYFLEHRDLFPEPESSWDFIGGEPLLETELIDLIIKHIKLRSYQLGHPWFERSWFGMSSNGSLFGTEQAQELFRKHGKRLDIGITIDGPAHVHDMERVFPDGSGTHASVLKNIPLWLKRRAYNPGLSTKVTISHDNLQYLTESMLYLFSLGVPVVNANVVFENAWKPGDDAILEQQLNKLGDTMLEQGLWRSHSCSFFTDYIGKPLSAEDDRNWCGCGKHMVAVDSDGVFYPCVRFTGFSLTNKPPITMGNINEGFDPDVRDRFTCIKRSEISPKECMECQVASGCAWCPGFNYDDDKDCADGIGKRAVYICDMHKARVRANTRYQTRLKEIQESEGGVPFSAICKDGKCLVTTGKRIGSVTEEEAKRIETLFLRREALADLFLLLPELDVPDLYERVLEDTGRAVQAYQEWWGDMSAKYGWKTGDGWRVDFESGAVFLE